MAIIIHGKNTVLEAVKSGRKVFELYVLKGMGELLSELPELFIELNDTLLNRAGTSKKEVYEFLKEKGYKYQTNLGQHNYHITSLKE